MEQTFIGEINTEIGYKMDSSPVPNTRAVLVWMASAVFYVYLLNYLRKKSLVSEPNLSKKRVPLTRTHWRDIYQLFALVGVLGLIYSTVYIQA